MVGIDRGVCAGAHRDLVLAVLVDHDQGNAGRLASQHRDPFDVDPLGLQLGQCSATVVVVAHGGDQPHLHAGPRRGNRGIGSLAATERLQSPTDDRLARRRQRRSDHDEIDVDGPHDHDDRILRGHRPDVTHRPSTRRVWSLRTVSGSANSTRCDQSVIRETSTATVSSCVAGDPNTTPRTGATSS